VFASSLETVDVKVGNAVTYSLPSQIDPDEDDLISITIDLKSALSFTKYDASS